MLIGSVPTWTEEFAARVSVQFTAPAEVTFGALNEAVMPAGKVDVSAALAPAAFDGTVTPCTGWAVMDTVAYAFGWIDKVQYDI
jgi:hypothetical protein